MERAPRLGNTAHSWLMPSPAGLITTRRFAKRLLPPTFGVRGIDGDFSASKPLPQLGCDATTGVVDGLSRERVELVDPQGVSTQLVGTDDRVGLGCVDHTEAPGIHEWPRGRRSHGAVVEAEGRHLGGRQKNGHLVEKALLR